PTAFFAVSPTWWQALQGAKTFSPAAASWARAPPPIARPTSMPSAALLIACFIADGSLAAWLDALLIATTAVSNNASRCREWPRWWRGADRLRRGGRHAKPGSDAGVPPCPGKGRLAKS